jgi:hypothetical protein
VEPVSASGNGDSDADAAASLGLQLQLLLVQHDGASRVQVILEVMWQNLKGCARC